MKEIGQVYCHISNGGIKFTIQDAGDNYGPKLIIESSQFGNNVQTNEILLGVNALNALAELFVKASKHKFTGEYCNKADIN